MPAISSNMPLSQTIIPWYQKHKRDLPWRHTHNPYIIWLSEIILQQTRVEQGMPYFYRFLEKYPTVHDFAAAEEDEILHLWQGLGYYSRGRNMLETARQVVEKFKGVFPVKYDELVLLKGIGSYTAAAISSFAANEPHAVVDGNVYRVLARYFGVTWPSSHQQGKKQVAVLANEILDKKHAGLHNQAMIEFGALLCKPVKPNCAFCPVNKTCFAHEHGKVNMLPVKKEKKQLLNRYFHLFILTDNEAVLLNRRGNHDIWAGLYQPILVETAGQKDFTQLMAMPEIVNQGLDNFMFEKTLAPVVHLLTHQRIHISSYIFITTALSEKKIGNYEPVHISKLKRKAFPQPILRLFENIFNL